MRYNRAPQWRHLVSILVVSTLMVLHHQAQALTPQKSIVISFNDTSAPDSTPPLAASSTVEETTAIAATSAATPAPMPTPTPALTNDMRKILRKVGSIPCVEPTRSRMFAILYESNVWLHDTCIADSGYQFFPYPGELPTTAQIVATVKSTACMQLHAGVILAEFPECDIDFVSVRSSAEVFYRIKKDVDADRVPPTQAQFYEFYNLNRVVNLLNENASLIENVFRENPATAAVSLSEMTRLMNPIVLVPGITLGVNMSITIATAKTATETASSSPSSDMDDTAGTGSGSAWNGRPQSTPAPTPGRLTPAVVNTTNHTSSAMAITRAPGGAWRCVGMVVAATALSAIVIAS